MNNKLLTEPELAAIHRILESASGLFAATGTSEMLVTYPSQFVVHDAPTNGGDKDPARQADP